MECCRNRSPNFGLSAISFLTVGEGKKHTLLGIKASAELNCIDCTKNELYPTVVPLEHRRISIDLPSTSIRRSPINPD